MGEAAFHELRSKALAAALAGLEPRPRGRPRKEEATEPPRIRELEQENQDLKIDLRAAQIREEIALMMPHLLKGDRGKKKAKSPKGGKRKRKNR